MSSEELSEASDRSMSSREDLTLEDTEETREGSGEEEAEEGVAVAQPPRDSSKQAVALTGSSALDILDQVSPVSLALELPYDIFIVIKHCEPTKLS